MFDRELQATLAAYAPDVVRVDVFHLMRKIVGDPEEYGFSNVTTPCWTGTSVCATPDTYLFWDHVHPTTTGHELLAEKFAEAINKAFVRPHRRALR